MSEIPNLWPNDLIKEEHTVTPYAIMKEQAAALGQRTEGLLLAEVVRSSDSDGDFQYHFRLKAPSIMYTYNLFWIWHKPLMFYPVHVNFNREQESLDSEGDFLEWLKKVFNSVETRRVINSILMQVKEGDVDIPF